MTQVENLAFLDSSLNSGRTAPSLLGYMIWFESANSVVACAVDDLVVGLAASNPLFDGVFGFAEDGGGFFSGDEGVAVGGSPGGECLHLVWVAGDCARVAPQAFVDDFQLVVSAGGAGSSGGAWCVSGEACNAFVQVGDDGVEFCGGQVGAGPR